MITTCLKGSIVELINNWSDGRPNAYYLPPVGSRAKVIENRDGKYMVVEWLDGSRAWLNRKRFKEVKPPPVFSRGIPAALCVRKSEAT